ncbi:MAG: 3-isopropylmalate dehydratase small subunit [Microcystaceae cyanobacterium]
MSQIQHINGQGIPLRGNDIDTDRIIPARFLRCVTFDGLGANVFADDRTQLQGQHPFDQPQYQGATILVVNGNFGCGSSREHAPQAIIKWGIQAIIGESFAEIFLGNCTTNGIPCLTASSTVINALQTALEKDAKTAIALDIENLTLTYDHQTIPLELNEGARQTLITGKWDSCGQLIQNFEQIRTQAATLPYLTWQSVGIQTT